MSDPLSTELSELLAERRRARHNGSAAAGEKLRAQLAELRQQRTTLAASHRPRIAELERVYAHAEPGDLRAGMRLDAQRVKDQAELSALDSQIAEVNKALNAPVDRGGSFRQWERPGDAPPLTGGEAIGASRSDRSFFPEEAFPDGRDRPA